MPESDVEDIIDLENLSLANNLTKIFQKHFQNPNLHLTTAKDFDKLSGKNDFYNSEIRKARFTLCDRRTEEEKDLHVVIKSQLNDRFHRLTGKFSQPFTKEVFWYSKASRDLWKLFPQIKGITYHLCTYLEVNTRLLRYSAFQISLRSVTILRQTWT